MKDEGSMETAKGQGVMRPTKGDQVRAKRAVPPFVPIAPRDVRPPVLGLRTNLTALDRNPAFDTLAWRRVAVARPAGELAR
jgi:hypothetical protein